jgi:hypothetical protein
LDFGCPELETFFAEFTVRVNEAIDSGALVNGDAVIVIENWQEDLKKVTLRITWDSPDSGEKRTYERHIYIHRNHRGE